MAMLPKISNEPLEVVGAISLGYSHISLEGKVAQGSSRHAGMWMRCGDSPITSLRGITPRRLTLQTGIAPCQSKYRREGFRELPYCGDATPEWRQTFP
jgi:hypothetical protein